MVDDIKILVIEDDAETAADILQAIDGAGWSAHHCATGGDGVSVAGGGFDAIVLDRMLPDTDGMAVLEEIRGRGILPPVLILSNLAQTRHRIEGLDAGGDDYLPKPFDPDELIARLRTLIRRQQRERATEWLRVGHFSLHRLAKTMHYRGRYVNLSSQEFTIFVALCENADSVVSREMIWRDAWPAYNNLPPRQNVMDVGISRLRKKLEAATGFDPIVNVRGKGFMLRTQ